MSSGIMDLNTEELIHRQRLLMGKIYFGGTDDQLRYLCS